MASQYRAVTPRELSSWKQIAAYLGVSIRTAQSWEQERGLPVRRLAGPRGRVTTTVEELESWKQSHAELRIVPASPSPWRLPVLITAVAGLAVIVTLLLGLRARHGPPALYRVEQNVLTVLDAQERVLWRHVFAEEVHAAAYAPGAGERVWFRDLDGDGRPEVLVAEVPWPSRSRSNVLHCFRDDGREWWNLTPGRSVRTAAETFTNQYSIAEVAFFPAAGGVRLAIAATHQVWYPAQVLIVNTDGRVLREYWHSGHLDHVGTADFDGSGTKIFLAGVDNARHAATLLVADPATMSGSAQEDNPAYQLQGLPPGRGVRRFLFPRSCMNQALEPYNTVFTLTIDRTGVLLDIGERLGDPHTPNILYRFDRNLHLQAVTPGDGFLGAHKQLERTGMLDHAFSPAEQGRWREVRVLTE